MSEQFLFDSIFLLWNMGVLSLSFSLRSRRADSSIPIDDLSLFRYSSASNGKRTTSPPTSAIVDSCAHTLSLYSFASEELCSLSKSSFPFDTDFGLSMEDPFEASTASNKSSLLRVVLIVLSKLLLLLLLLLLSFFSKSVSKYPSSTDSNEIPSSTSVLRNDLQSPRSASSMYS